MPVPRMGSVSRGVQKPILPEEGPVAEGRVITCPMAEAAYYNPCLHGWLCPWAVCAPQGQPTPEPAPSS